MGELDAFYEKRNPRFLCLSFSSLKKISSKRAARKVYYLIGRKKPIHMTRLCPVRLSISILRAK